MLQISPYLFFLLLFASPLFGQQLPLSQEYQQQAFFLNPASLGQEGVQQIQLGYKQQWLNMPESPRTASLAYQHWAEDKNMAWGLALQQDRTGPSSYTALQFSYAYQLQLGKVQKGEFGHRLNLGLSLSALHYQLRGQDLSALDPNDPLIIQNNESQLLPEAALGALYQTEQFQLGFSVPQILGLKLRFSDGQALSDLRRVAHIYLHAATKIDFYSSSFRKAGDAPKHRIIPQIWFRYALNSPFGVMLNAQYIYDQRFLLGLGYGSEGSLMVSLGTTVKQRYRISYIFSQTASNLGPQLGSNHELLLAYTLFANGKGWQQPAISSIWAK
ncbi:PorP/SprF family type IX secretion system membrane protein [Saprospira grandis]|uniref:PorP/SprF family type IX secretion system membrane protein n=1 Tax=Saprospira grandis TaxID=1008 RepID=UPI0022DCECA2|nr:PorP/SprF family type IX secretion system membrane protein [Saprospira grandis]WBM74664.1 PorP/SprF family type IX secretion system membrane protein [Saprospira grandis]